MYPVTVIWKRAWDLPNVSRCQNNLHDSQNKCPPLQKSMLRWVVQKPATRGHARMTQILHTLGPGRNGELEVWESWAACVPEGQKPSQTVMLLFPSPYQFPCQCRSRFECEREGLSVHGQVREHMLLQDQVRQLCQAEQKGSWIVCVRGMTDARKL